MEKVGFSDHDSVALLIYDLNIFIYYHKLSTIILFDFYLVLHILSIGQNFILFSPAMWKLFPLCTYTITVYLEIKKKNDTAFFSLTK